MGSFALAWRFPAGNLSMDGQSINYDTIRNRLLTARRF
jgi:hypothetical protein